MYKAISNYLSKGIFIFLMLFAFACSIHTDAYAAAGQLLIEDDADIYTDADEEKIRSHFLRCYDKANCLIVTNDDYITDLNAYVDSEYILAFGKKPGTVIVFATSSNNVLIKSYGSRDLKQIDSQTLDTIMAKVAKASENGAYLKGTNKALSLLNKAYGSRSGLEEVPEKTWYAFILTMVLIAFCVLVIGLMYLTRKENILKHRQKQTFISTDNDQEGEIMYGSEQKAADSVLSLILSIAGFVATIEFSLYNILSAAVMLKEKETGLKGTVTTLSDMLQQIFLSKSEVPLNRLELLAPFIICSIAALIMAAGQHKTGTKDTKCRLSYAISLITIAAFIAGLIMQSISMPIVLVFACLSAIILLCIFIISL